MSISVELADKLVHIMEVLKLRQISGINVKYDQGEPLKGLLRSDDNYPSIWLDLDHDSDPPAGHHKLINRPLAAITHPIEGSPNWDSFERLRGADFIR
jgi:hypothetical protein